MKSFKNLSIAVLALVVTNSIAVSVFSQSARASDDIEKTCIETKHGKLCARVALAQDSSMVHQAIDMREFELDGSKIVRPILFSARFLCRELTDAAFPNVYSRIKPALPFGMAVETERKVVRYTMYANGDCRGTSARVIRSVSCYAYK